MSWIKTDGGALIAQVVHIAHLAHFARPYLRLAACRPRKTDPTKTHLLPAFTASTVPADTLTGPHFIFLS